jgi:uncharacterized membrane protein YfcA
MELAETAYHWFISLGDEYGVDPFIFGAIYIGAIPFFSISVIWALKNFREKKSVVLPVLTAIFCFISAYLYLLIAGENVPWWVYVIVIVVILYGGWSTFNKLKKRVRKEVKEIRL